MTAHVQHHEGWVGSGKVSTLLALLSAMGTDCSLDFNSTHDARGFRELHASSLDANRRFVFRLIVPGEIQLCSDLALIVCSWPAMRTLHALMPLQRPHFVPSRRPTRSVYSTGRTSRLRRARLSRDYPEMTPGDPEMTRDQITRDALPGQVRSTCSWVCREGGAGLLTHAHWALHVSAVGAPVCLDVESQGSPLPPPLCACVEKFTSPSLPFLQVRYFTWEELSASGRIRNRPRAAAAPPRLADRAGPPPAERAAAPPPLVSATAPQPAETERATAALCGFCECSPCADGCPGLERSDCQGAL